MEFEVKRYGAVFPPIINPSTGAPCAALPDWEIERQMCLCEEDKAPRGWLGKAEHFKKFASLIFASPASKQPWEWNPNACEILERYLEHNFLAIAGHGSSGKTETLAIIAISEFLMSPHDTGCLITSTTLAESRGRIWGRIEHYWQEACEFFGGESNTPGKLVSSAGMIRYCVNGKVDNTKGLKLVPGRESEVKEGIGRMKGFKARRMRLFGDEFSDLSHKLLEAAETNLFLNEDFKMAVAFNPNSFFDPAGVMSEPKGGWGTVDIMNSDGWETKRGWCIRFDGVKSPNVLLGTARWKGLLTKEKLEDRRKNLGDDSPGFIAQYRGAWSETGNRDAIYSEPEFLKYLAMKKVEVWQSPPILMAGFDPSFTHGGDRAVVIIGKVGSALGMEGRFVPTAELTDIIFLDSGLDNRKDKSEAVLERLKSALVARGMSSRNLAMDASGGGTPFATLMKRDAFFSNAFMEVQFGGKASDLFMEGHKASDRFANMVSELWYAGKPLLRGGQLRGLKPELINEMKCRLYEETGGGIPKIKVEPKEDMKKRMHGMSPDIADAYFLFLHVARSRGGLNTLEGVAKRAKKPPPKPEDEAIAWGKKKRPRMIEPEYVAQGGGWGYDDALSTGGMFGGFN